MIKRIKLIAVFSAITIALFGITGCGNSGSDSAKNATENESATSQQSEPSSQEPEAPATPAEITFDVPFEFDDLTITFHSPFQTATVENQFSEHDGKTVITIPLSIVNNSSGTKGLNVFYYKMFGPNGTELDTVSSYFTDTDVAFAGDIRSGATLETTMNILYDGDGDYYVSFDNYKEKIEVKLPIAV